MTQMERIEHRKMIEKDAKNNVQELLLGNDWLKSGDYTPSRKLQENVSWFELECMPLSCLLYTSPSPRDGLLSRMPSSA